MAASAERQQKGDKILEAAVRVFAEKGFKAAALEQVARHAGTAKGTLYLYFRDKQELYFKALLRVFDKVQAHVEACAAREEGPVQKLTAIARGQLEYFVQHREAMRLVAGMLAPGLAGLRKRLFGVLQERRRTALQELGKIVEEAQRQGLVRGDIESRFLVLSYVGVLGQAGQELMMQAGVEAPACPLAGPLAPSPDSAAERAELVMKILMEGMAPRRS